MSVQYRVQSLGRLSKGTKAQKVQADGILPSLGQDGQDGTVLFALGRLESLFALRAVKANGIGPNGRV